MKDSTNRSTGTAMDYLREISKGKRLKEVAFMYGVSHAAVHHALKRAGLPTCARMYLETVSEGRK